MSERRVTITGGSGFVGQLIRPGLRERGYRVDVFDRVRGPLVDALRRTWVGAGASPEQVPRAQRLRARQARAEQALVRARLIRPSWDDVMDLRSRLAERFRGSHAVVHLAALPHPNFPGAAEEDFRRINFDAAANVLGAAVAAGVPRFVFASSAQVYSINEPVRIDQFPVLETNYLPTREEGQSAYGAIKVEFERHMENACRAGSTQAVALRLECPGVLSTGAFNFYASTSIENTAAAFACAIEAPLDTGFEVFNAVDGEVDPAVADVQEFLRSEWPGVPNHTRGNESLLSVEKARKLLGYQPQTGGTYYPVSLIWG